MSKKDFQLIAGALFDTQPRINTGKNESGVEWLQWDRVVRALAETLKIENPRFDKERFLSACYTGKEVRRQ